MERVEERVSDGRILDSAARLARRQDILKGLERWTPTAGHAARRGDQPVAGQHLPAPAGRADGGAGLSDGALCGRLRGSVPEPRRGRRCPGGDQRAGWRRTAFVCIRTRRTSATAGSRGKASTSSAIGSKPAGAGCARRASTRLQATSIREKTRRTRGESLARIVADLNPTLRGWFGYFKHAFPGAPSRRSTGSSATAAGAPAQAGEAARPRPPAVPTINAGPMTSSRKPGCSRCTRPG